MIKLLLIAGLTILSFSNARVCLADESENTIQQTTKEAKKSVRKGVRSVQDKTCELVDGKMICAGKKLKHKVQNLSDAIKN